MIARFESKGCARGTIALVALALLSLSSCGNAVEYYSDGVRRAEGPLVFRSEKRIPASSEREDGTWTWWYPNGERRESGTHAEGHRTGEWTQWYPNGQRRSRGERVWSEALHASPREGMWTYWHENGEILSRGVFVNGAREGHWDFSREDGSLDPEYSGEYHLDQRLD
ncbi:MAG: hypothetical protein SGI72_09525 [Planctomycetota bacterium]|nr:hypothetical protein [Planctomycetota bacterium]